jgi:hypothetical protein
MYIEDSLPGGQFARRAASLVFVATGLIETRKEISRDARFR